jgi:hypothetical protein
VLVLFALSTHAQESPFYKFGKVGVADLQKKIYSIDSNAHAVVLSDIGDVAIEGNSKGWFSLVYKRHSVIHILNKSGYSYADVSIPLYTNGSDEERLDRIKAITYNLENGQIVETKLEKSSIFKEKRSKIFLVQKFTMPNVKEGSIIEYEYQVTSDFIQNLQPWAFQGSAPRLWSEYKLRMPQFFNYAFISQGYLRFFIKDSKDNRENFSLSNSRNAGPTERASFVTGVTDYRWVMKDVPELKQESYTSSIDNYIAKIEFQLSGTRDPLQYSDWMGTWGDLAKRLMKSEYFGESLNGSNGWMSDDMKAILTNATTDVDKAKKIFAFVRDNFTCTDHSAVYTDQSLKNVMKTKKGSVSEINLLLTAMLRYAKLNADPVILSTRSNGFTYPLYPMLSKFNYVVAQTKIGDDTYYLDATHPRLGFGKLTNDCYNGHARVIGETAAALELVPDSLKESKLTSLFITNDDKGKWVGGMNQTLGYYESLHVRDEIKEKGKDVFIKELKKAYTNETKLSNFVIDSLDKYDYPVALHYDIDFEKPAEDILYINPMFGEGYKKNPFKSEDRFYPVEMPYTADENFILTIDVPEGYVVDEIPKQMVMKLDEKNTGFFEYRIAQSGSTISLRTRLKINRTTFYPEEYEVLREFFNLVVKKQNEQIVFKKKK